MAQKFVITSPEGQEFEISAPEGASQAEILDYAKRNFAMMPKAASKPMSDNGASWGGVDNFASGVLQGMGDEVKALTQATKAQFNGGPSFGNAYDQAKTMYQGAREKYNKENPIKGAVTDFAGQAAPWLAASPLMPAMSATSMTGRMAQGGLMGLGTGAVSGGLNAEGDMIDRAKGAGTGAAIGFGAGALAPPVIDAARKGASWIANQTINRLPFRQQTAANRKVAEALMRDGLTPDEALARMQQMGPEAALMDVGENTRGLARSAGTVPGEGRTSITDFLKGRQEGVRDANGVIQGGQVNRIGGMLDDIVPERYRGSMDDLARQRRVDAKPLYDEAFAPRSDKAGKVYAQWDDRLQQFLDDPIVKQGMNKGIRVQQLEALAEGKPFNFQEYAVKGFDNNGGLIIDGTPNLRAMDAAKRGMDEILEGYRDKTTGKLVLDDMGRAIDKVRKSLVSKLDDITTDDAGRSAYREARQAWAGPSRLKDALATGRDILGGQFKNADEMAALIKDMTPDELHYMRIGAVQDLRDRIGNVVTRGDATKQLMEKHGLEGKIRLAFGDDQTFKRYISTLENERAMFDSYGKILGGSRTAELGAEQADAAVDPGRIIQGIQQMFSGSPIRGAMNAIGGAKDRLVMTEPMSRNLGQMMTGRDVGPLNQAYQTAQLSEEQRRRIAQIVAQMGGIGGGAAQR